MTDVLGPESWRRVGRGRRSEFPDLRAEQIGAVLAALPADLGPYRLVLHELVPGPERYVSRTCPVDPARLAELVAEGHWNYFIVSERLSPGVVAKLPDVDSAMLSLNGAISLQIGARNRLGPEAPSLGIVAKVATRAGESRTHDEYSKIYDAALRAVRKLTS
ncbi:hypothetical protein AB0L64_17860 [Kribbella sp. NPDC051936]|uniref:hypothetical protein n=1 Tax=Kribbella sp. NPDC051936 TaxID=3154946 RepID=UPI00341F2E38